MKLSGHTTPFAVLGHPIGHTLSPVMHNAAFQALDMNAVYLAFDVHPDRLLEVLPAMQNMGFGGVNLTVPLKEIAFKSLDKLDKSAQRLGSVNTVEFTNDGHMIGHNTDGKGFVLAIKEAFNKTIEGLSVLVIGSGGAGRAVAITCAAEGASTVSVADLDKERSERVAKEVSDNFHNSDSTANVVSTDAMIAIAQTADLIVHATPVGMKKDDPSLLPAEAFREGQIALDLIYMYPETPFTKEACKGGALTSNGLGMLLHQGAHSFTIWTGRPAAAESMRKALETEVYKGEQ